MKIVFFGTPELSVQYLEMLHLNHSVLAVVCNPDQPIGRKQIITPPPTKKWALEHDIPVMQPTKLRDIQTDLEQLQADIFVLVAYGKILPESIINLPPFGTLNVHYSLLPRWRGASPVEAAVLAGDTLSGVCVQQMRYELDTGPIYIQENIEIPENAFARELRDGIMTETGVKLLEMVLEQIESGTITLPTEQVGEPTHCTRIVKSDGELLESDSEIQKWRKYRAYMPWPGVFTFDEDGRRVKINEAKFEQDMFIPTVITRDGEQKQKLV